MAFVLLRAELAIELTSLPQSEGRPADESNPRQDATSFRWPGQLHRLVAPAIASTTPSARPQPGTRALLRRREVGTTRRPRRAPRVPTETRKRRKLHPRPR